MISIVLIMFRIYASLPIFEVLIVFFSILAMILGVSLALTQTDFRRMIGFLAVGELGFIGLGIGLGTNFAITAGLFQAINEIVITALLFIGFGAIVNATNEVGIISTDLQVPENRCAFGYFFCKKYLLTNK